MTVTKGHPPRLKGWDYSRSAAYFVTFSVAARRPVLGALNGSTMMLSPTGRIVDDCWLELPSRFLGVELDAQVIMPDHVHAIISLPSVDTERDMTAHQQWQPMMTDTTILLGKVVRTWKALATR